MKPEDVSAILAGATVVATLVAIASAVLAAKQARSAKEQVDVAKEQVTEAKLQTKAAERQVDAATRTYQIAAFVEMGRQMSEWAKNMEVRDPLPPEPGKTPDADILTGFCNFLEGVALLIKFGVVPRQWVTDAWGTWIARGWTKCEGLLANIRGRQGTCFERAESLAEKCIATQASTTRVPQHDAERNHQT